MGANEFDLMDFYKESAIRQAKEDEQNILNKSKRYIKDIEHLTSLIPADTYEVLSSKLKDVKIKGIPNYKHGKALYKNMAIVYEEFTFEIEFEETYSNPFCRLLISIDTPFKMGYKVEDEGEYILKKKSDVLYNEFAKHFNHAMIIVLSNLAEGCNKELDNTVRFDLGTGIGRGSYSNRRYFLLEKKINSNKNVIRNQNLFGNGYYYVMFEKESYEAMPLFTLNKIEPEVEIVKSYCVIIYYSYGAYGEHISADNPYLEQTMNFYNKLSEISKAEDVRIVLNTKATSSDIILDEDEQDMIIVTLKDLVDNNDITTEEFKLFNQIINHPKDSYQKEIKRSIQSKRTSKGVTYYPFVKYMYISQRLHDEESMDTTGNRTKDGELKIITFNNYQREY